jgi:hypothetical protein
MARVKVYGVANQWVFLPRMATREGIAIMHGKIIEGSELEIDDSQLEYGRTVDSQILHTLKANPPAAVS